jgi:hypothetical protein
LQVTFNLDAKPLDLFLQLSDPLHQLLLFPRALFGYFNFLCFFLLKLFGMLLLDVFSLLLEVFVKS